MVHSRAKRIQQLTIAAASAFAVYFCMYAFRKPFTATSYDNAELWGNSLKTTLVLSQLAGYMLSKFLGIKVVSEMPARQRGLSILVLIGIAEISLVAFAVVPMSLKPLALFLNGLPLGMVFGLVMSFLEGRKQTEALSAALCASFIISSGVVKSVGQWLIVDWNISDYWMPSATGLIFLPLLLLSVAALQLTPPPDEDDLEHRSERKPMTREDRWRFFRAYWPGLCLLIFVYVALTVIRTIRDDFAVEIWRDLGVEGEPAVFAQSETLVAFGVTLINSILIWITHNLSAMRLTIVMMCTAFLLVVLSTLAQIWNLSTPFTFMVLGGVGLYVPYVAFHTTVFERLIALSRHPGNIGFLMYLADAMGYLGYALVLGTKTFAQTPEQILPFFRVTLISLSVLSVAALSATAIYLRWVLHREAEDSSVR